MSVNCIRNLLEYSANRVGDKVALINKNKSITYSELLEKVNKIANYLEKQNLPQGARVGVYSNKSIEQVIAILAILSTRLTLVPITRLLKSEQISYIVEDCDISMIITDEKKVETIKQSSIFWQNCYI